MTIAFCTNKNKLHEHTKRKTGKTGAKKYGTSGVEILSDGSA